MNSHEYALEVLKLAAGNQKFLPNCRGCDKSLNLYMELDKSDSLYIESENFFDCIEVLGMALKCIYEKYGKKYSFFEPNLVFLPHRSMVRIGVQMCKKEDL